MAVNAIPVVVPPAAEPVAVVEGAAFILVDEPLKRHPA